MAVNEPGGQGAKGRPRNYAARLPDAYAKEENSVNARLLQLNQSLAEAARADIYAVGLAAGLEEAFGGALDLYGEMVGQPRGALDDSRYRYLIRSRIARGFTAGDHESVLLAVRGLFGAKEGELGLQDDEGHPGRVRLTKLPFAILSSAGLSARQAVQLIEQLVPIGVRVVSDNFEGSFCFAATAGEYAEDAGFSDAAAPAAQTLGGYLGFAIGEDESTPLPLLA